MITCTGRNQSFAVPVSYLRNQETLLATILNENVLNPSIRKILIAIPALVVLQFIFSVTAFRKNIPTGMYVTFGQEYTWSIHSFRGFRKNIILSSILFFENNFAYFLLTAKPRTYPARNPGFTAPRADIEVVLKSV